MSTKAVFFDQNVVIMSQDPAAYAAVDNLKIMELAERYNEVLTARISRVLGEDQEVVLDYGAGTGTFAQQLSARGYQVQCLEPDERMATALRQAGFACELDSASYVDAFFSCVYSLNVLEHIADDTVTLREFHRLLRPRGKLILFVPAFDLLYSSMDRKVGHVRRYMRSSLREKVEQAGFRVLRCSYFDSLGFFASLAYRLLGNRRGDLDSRKIVFYDRWLLPISLLGDRILHHVLGKNVFLIAERRDGK